MIVLEQQFRIEAVTLVSGCQVSFYRIMDGNDASFPSRIQIQGVLCHLLFHRTLRGFYICCERCFLIICFEWNTSALLQWWVVVRSNVGRVERAAWTDHRIGCLPLKYSTVYTRSGLRTFFGWCRDRIATSCAITGNCLRVSELLYYYYILPELYVRFRILYVPGSYVLHDCRTS